MKSRIVVIDRDAFPTADEAGGAGMLVFKT